MARQPRASAAASAAASSIAPTPRPPMCGRDGDGIEPRHQRARAEQHDGGAGEAGRRPAATITSALGDVQEAPQAAARQPVGGEDAMLERGQRVEVAALGLADADCGVRRMGERGGHRHQQGRHIDTSFDTSFATPAHRPHGRSLAASPHRRHGMRESRNGL